MCIRDSLHHGRLKTISNFLMAKGIAPYRMRITNTHHDFLTAIQEVAASSSTPYLEETQILITIINLKEEIILNPTPPLSSHFGGRMSDVGAAASQHPKSHIRDPLLGHLIKAVSYLDFS